MESYNRRVPGFLRTNARGGGGGQPKIDSRRRIIFSDLDGTFLDEHTYSFDESVVELRRALAGGVDVVFCSSKTRAEIEELLETLDLMLPYIAENGGVVCIPEGYFESELPDLPRSGAYRLAVLGVPHEALVNALSELREEMRLDLRGFSDMQTQEIAELTGLDDSRAELARQREFDEPFVAEAIVPEAELRLAAAASRRRLRVVRGGRFFHLTGLTDKGAAIRWLSGLFQRESGAIWTAGIGDSANDISMLSVVDYPVLVRRPGGSYDASALRAVPRARRMRGIGPEGWVSAVRGILRGVPL